MLFQSDEERRFVQIIVDLTHTNPFLPQYRVFEKQLTGEQSESDTSAWSYTPESLNQWNVTVVDSYVRILKPYVARFRKRLVEGVSTGKRELSIYARVVTVYLFFLHRTEFLRALSKESEGPRDFQFFTDFRKNIRYYFANSKWPSNIDIKPERIFADYFQLLRAGELIFKNIVGGSASAASLRAAVYDSIFTHDLGRYWRYLIGRMRDIPTLITGPSGTGKELVARAIGMSQFIPFDAAKKKFEPDYRKCFYALNLSALPATLIESELFGHRKGAFTGAIEDKAGWLEECGEWGTVFLDEIGELDATLQVKLLRVLESRTFQRLGETEVRHFKGKIIAATNRDLGQEIEANRFREDLYYRLCADQVVTPSLREQIADDPKELRNFVHYLCGRMVGDDAERLTEEVMEWITQKLPNDYPWPGNIRELDQCVRSILVRKEYRPVSRSPKNARERLAAAVCSGTLTEEELLRHYSNLVYAQTNNYVAAGQRLQIDRRTVKDRIDSRLLGQYRDVQAP